MWFFMLQSGIHATIAGVLLAFTIPFTPIQDDRKSPSYILEHFLHKPVAFFIMPVFALCNTGIVIGAGFLAGVGFTMSIFITNLAYKTTPELVNSSIMAVLLTSLVAGIIGYAWLMTCGKRKDTA